MPLSNQLDPRETDRVEAAPRVLPGDAGFWYFIAADAIVFALLFFQFSVDRSSHASSYDAGRRELLVPLGATNTLILVTSSLVVAVAVRFLREDRRRQASTLAFAAAGLGLCFAVIKVCEYVHAAGAGDSPTANTFFMYYFVITGIHLLHLVVGMVGLIVAGIRLRGRRDSGRNQVIFESVASYWHLVDLLWLFIFPLLYLAR